MAQNDNVVFKTSTTATIDDLFSWNKSTGQITAKTDNIPIVPGTVYFTADGHIVHDLAQNNRLWMSKNAYSAIYAEDVAETNTDIANAIKYSIHYVEGPTTDTTPGTWTGTINGITELYDGLTIIYVPAVAGGSSTTTLNINGLGEKTCYYNNTNKITTHYSAGTPILLTYRNNCWRRADYNSNTTYSAMSVAEMRTGTASSERSIRADYLKIFLSTLGGTNLTLTHSNSAPYLQLNHDPSGITAGTYGNSSQQTPSYGGTFNIPYFTVDTQGHITNASVTTVKIPESDNTDYKVRQTPINSNDNNNYRILLSNSANDTSEDSISKKNANLIYNPTENKLSTGNIKLTGELDVTGNVYLRNQTTVDNLTARGLIVNGNSTFNNDINLAQGAVKWTSNSLPSATSADYFLVIDAFANGGATKHITKANAIKSLISSSAIGSSTKPVYWTGSAFSAITSYSGAATLTGTPTAPTAAAGTNTTQIATTEFVTNAVAQGFVANDAMVFKGLIGNNQLITQLPTSGYNAGWTYRVANAGIFAGEYCEVGDLLIAINDGPASGSSVINTDWGKVEHNIDGAVFRGSGASNSSVGSSTQPVYVNGSGIVTAITGAIANDTTGNAATATTLATGRTLKVNLASTSASTAFNGAANITDIGVSGILPIAQGGTGQDNTDNFVKVYSRSDMGNSINYDDPGVNGLFEARKSSEITATGEWPGGMESWFPLLSLKTSSVIMQIAGNSQYGYGWWIRGRQGTNATLAGIAWERLVTNSGTWGINITGNATTATTASKLSNNSKIGDTNKPVYFKADGTPAAISYTIATSVPSGAVFTDRYVNSAAFTDDSTNTAASPVKMTLTRAGSDTATITANIPKVSSSSAGVVPKGTTVSSQSQSTKFLREDGTWAAPSYTVNTNTDTLVKQTAKSDDKKYKVLFTKSDSPTSGNASEAAYDTAITINPSTHTLTAVNLKGILSTQDLRRPTGLRGLNDVTLQPLVSTVRANRLAFLPADQIIIEKTTDGGATWVDAGISDIDKLKLFSEQRSGGISLPMINGARNVLCGLRITFTAIRYNVPAGTPETEKYNYWNSTYFKSTERYCQLKELYFWLNSLSDSIGVTVQRATGKNPNNWSTIFDDSSFYMTGWSGCNYVNFSQHIFGGFGSQAGYPWNYRITFMTKGVDGTNTMATSSTTTPQTIEEIRGYGDSYWAVSNSYMARDHIYSFDANKNTTFPANVSATKFIGPLEGNAATATTAGGITSAGTTAQFWRGDNTWSNMLEQTAETTLGIDTSNSRIGTAVRTLHIATNWNGTGAGITVGNAAGITFGISTAAYAGIYYQSSGSYGSRLYFATTDSFGNGAYARMMITHDGKVGIHTTSPSTRLHVDGDVTVTGLTASQAVVTDANKKLVSCGIRNNTSAGALGWTSTATDITLVTTNTVAYWNGAYASTYSNLKYSANGEIMGLSTAQTVSGTKTFSAIQKFTNTTDSSHSQDAAAAVSISGGLSVAKKVSAKEVRIDNNQTSKGVSLQYDQTLEVLNFVFS